MFEQKLIKIGESELMANIRKCPYCNGIPKVKKTLIKTKPEHF